MTRPVLPDEVRRFLDTERVARLATADARGRPHLVPVVYAFQGDRVFIPIDRKPKKHADPRALRRVRNLCENPRASLLVDHYEEDWGRLAWFRVDGQATLLEGGPAYQEGARALTVKYPQYRARPLPAEGEGLMILLHIETVRSWRAGGGGPRAPQGRSSAGV
jgi:PPOX class probable F420-dependent enzyme